MKTNSKTIIIAAALFCSGSIYAQKKNTWTDNEVPNGLELSIEITNSASEHLSGAKVKIYHDNKFIAELNNDLQLDMKVSLEKNSYYVIEVKKSGYVTKSILVSTMLPEGSENTSYEHAVTVSLDKKENKTLLTPPLIGILYYDPKKDVYIGSPMMEESPDKEAIIAQLENWLGS